MELITLSEAKLAYDKLLKENRSLLNILEKSNELKSFTQAQKENNAYNGEILGVQQIPIEKIVGTVQKTNDFDANFIPINNSVQDRWCRLYKAYVDGEILPPVKLYKIKDEYFVYDGHHRISIAKYLKLDTIEAEVIEFLPNSDTLENIIYRERFIFEKTTGLSNIVFTEINKYNRLLNEINEYKNYIENKENREYNFLEISKIWYQNIYLPAINVIEKSSLLSSFTNKTLADLFVYFLDHKYYESEKKGKDVGFSYALIDYINFIKTKEDPNYYVPIDKDVIKNLKILYEIDKKKYLDPEILKKNEILKEYTGLDIDQNFLLLFEIDDYIEKNSIPSYRDGLERWYKENFINKLKVFQRKINFLPEQYSSKLEILLKDKKKLFYSIQNYQITCQKYNFNCIDLLANYIIQIYIPIVDILIKKGIDDTLFLEAYYGIHSKYNYLLEFNLNASMKEAADLYFSSHTKKYQKIHDWFLEKFNSSSKSEILIDYVIGKFENNINNVEEFRKILNKYGKPKKYGTIFKLDRLKDKLEENSNIDWLKDRLIPDLEQICNNIDCMIFYKTKSILNELDKDTEQMSLIDFYADVIDYAIYKNKDLLSLNIVDLVNEYKIKAT